MAGEDGDRTEVCQEGKLSSFCSEGSSSDGLREKSSVSSLRASFGELVNKGKRLASSSDLFKIFSFGIADE